MSINGLNSLCSFNAGFLYFFMDFFLSSLVHMNFHFWTWAINFFSRFSLLCLIHVAVNDIDAFEKDF
jgi:hypothetical protein